MLAWLRNIRSGISTKFAHQLLALQDALPSQLLFYYITYALSDVQAYRDFGRPSLREGEGDQCLYGEAQHSSQGSRLQQKNCQQRFERGQKTVHRRPGVFL